MDFIEQFEKPLPVINKELKEIYIETSNSCTGSFVIKNDGGGEIEGRITSNSRFISFEPEEFCGNNSAINFYVNLDIYSPGEVLRTGGLILSNGGEHHIEFIIKVIPYSIESREGDMISSLESFRNYAMEKPVAARQLFTNHEFMMWMHSSGNMYMDLYERFITDPNKERALDNFLLINKLKEKAGLSFEEKELTVNIPPFDNKMHRSFVNIKKIGWGYIDEEISCQGLWLNLSKNRLVSSDFDENNTATVDFTIDPLKFEQNINFGKIIAGGKSLMIKAVRLDFVNISAERRYLDFKDSSYILVTNNTSEKINVGILPRDNFIKFDRKVYSVGESARIPFAVEYPAILTARLNFSKQPSAETEIIVESAYYKEQFKKALRFKIGNFM